MAYWPLQRRLLFVPLRRALRVQRVLRMLFAAAALAAPLFGCASRSPSPRTGLDALQQAIEVVFRGGKAYARQGGREWLIAEVGREQMLWAPDGNRFAYLSEQTERREGELVHHVIVRNIRGDSVNEFPAYRPGRPAQLDWVDDRHLGYVAPGDGDSGGDVFVIHEVETAEIVRVHRGRGFIWSPGRERLAYVSGTRSHTVEIDGRPIWPGESASRRRRIVSELVWSPDGRSLTFLSLAGRRTELVVLLELDDPDGHLSWPLPAKAAAPTNKLFWGESRVTIGESLLKPRYAATWTRVQ